MTAMIVAVMVGAVMITATTRATAAMVATMAAEMRLEVDTAEEIEGTAEVIVDVTTDTANSALVVTADTEATTAEDRVTITLTGTMAVANATELMHTDSHGGRQR
mmetsp:Transcript_74125/g.206025  ORF Transcript_74125/g.206025 Transcript_74125/m.206025 type:complete len:105 (-) Transcript_74125:122-436(-)